MLGERRTFLGFDGEPLYYHAAGRGTPMLMTNGFVCTTQYWPQMVNFFRETHDVLTWDYRGHGENPAPKDLDTVNLTTFAHDMEALLSSHGGEPAILVGHSMGVQVCFEFYRRYPHKVKGIVAICGTFENPFASFSASARFQALLAKIASGLKPHSEMVARVLKPLLRSQLTMAISYRVGANPELLPRHYLEALYAHVTSMDFSVAIRLFESMVWHSAQEVLSDIRVPTLIIGGEKDGLTPPVRSKEIHEAIPNSECRIYEACTHLAMIEKSEQVLPDILDFLQRHQLLAPP